jgi:hypothetical protein
METFTIRWVMDDGTEATQQVRGFQDRGKYHLVGELSVKAPRSYIDGYRVAIIRVWCGRTEVLT